MFLRKLFEKYSRRFTSVSLIGGFIFDFLTLWRIDLFWEDLIFIVYLIVAALGIVYLTFHEAAVRRGRWADRFNIFFLFALQFMFGGLFGRFFIFYFRSGSPATSWPFLAIIAVLFIANERVRDRYRLFTYRMVVFFIALFSFANFFVPIVVSRLGIEIFLISGFLSLVVMIAFSYGMRRLATNVVRPQWRALIIGIAIIYGGITTMYFTNLIPPLPLSLEEAGVYHNVQRTAAGYSGASESRPWYLFYQQYPAIHIVSGDAVYVFASIFAPTDITTTVVHEWQYYDTQKSEWITASKIPYNIVGGKDGGYRGYTYKLRTQPGRWRVNIETERGQIIGRAKFMIINTGTEPPLQTIAL